MLPSANLLLYFFLAFISQFINPVASKQLSIGGINGCDDADQFRCGNVIIRNPFRPFVVGGWQPERCGNPIECRDNQSALIKINDYEYQVMHIDYDNKTLRLVPSSLVETDRSNCSYLSKMDSAMDVSPLFVYTAANSQITIYYNCSDISVDAQIYFRFSCSTENLASYAVVHDINTAYRHSCTNKTRTAVFQSAPDEGSEYLLDQGFEITWANNDPSGLCTDNPSCTCRFMSKAPIQPSMVCSFDNGTSGAPNERTPSPSPTPARFAGDDERRENKKIFTYGLLVDVMIFLLVCALLLVYFGLRSKNLFYSIFRLIKKPRNRNSRYVEAFLERFGPLAPQRYSYSEVEKMTNNFIEKLGQGGFGSVYKGKLPNGRLVAVKVLNNTRANGKDFFSEVVSIGCTYHVNVVSLLGFCLEDSRRALIYEFVSNGSLDKFIFSDDKSLHLLGWEKMYLMLHIAVGIARGLDYLHQGCNVEILHFDIKPHNILLDGEYCPKIADFGLAKLCRSEQSTISMLGARGTVGYMAPEVFSREVGVVSSKSDVYSYGMMVLKMIGGAKNYIGQSEQNSSRIHFSEWIHQQLDVEGDHLQQVLGLTTGVEEMIVRRMATVGLWCIQTVPLHRPSMNKVVAMLEGKMEDLPKPPLPSLFVRPPVPRIHVESAGRQGETHLLTPPSART